MKPYLPTVATFALLTLTACGAPDSPQQSTTDPENAQVTDANPNSSQIAEAITASLSHPDRPEEARKDDAVRKAADVITFTGIKSGDAVFEMEAGSGYYTEIISRIVGKDGHVILQNPAGFDTFLGEEIFVALLGEDGSRLPNVKRSKSNFDELDTEDNSIDVVTWILGPHELWYKGPEGKQNFGLPDKTFAEISRILKPGGHFIALDHVAAPGSPTLTGNTTHRIDPQIIKDLAQSAGLEFVGESDVLANKDDNYDVMVFDPSVRRKTDRFLHKYRNP